MLLAGDTTPSAVAAAVLPAIFGNGDGALPACVLGAWDSANWLAVLELFRTRGPRAPEPESGQEPGDTR
jgi:hypothetical protein